MDGLVLNTDKIKEVLTIAIDAFKNMMRRIHDALNRFMDEVVIAYRIIQRNRLERSKRNKGQMYSSFLLPKRQRYIKVNTKPHWIDRPMCHIRSNC